MLRFAHKPARDAVASLTGRPQASIDFLSFETVVGR
jgi:hypothetical protein